MKTKKVLVGLFLLSNLLEISYALTPPESLSLTINKKISNELINEYNEVFHLYNEIIKNETCFNVPSNCQELKLFKTKLISLLGKVQSLENILLTSGGGKGETLKVYFINPEVFKSLKRSCDFYYEEYKKLYKASEGIKTWNPEQYNQYLIKLGSLKKNLENCKRISRLLRQAQSVFGDNIVLNPLLTLAEMELKLKEMGLYVLQKTFSVSNPLQDPLDIIKKNNREDNNPALNTNELPKPEDLKPQW